eukprot:5545177-Pyramimonas_sp.AAC.1
MECGRERTTHHSYAWANLWKQIWTLIDEFGGMGPEGLTIEKIQAHVSRRRLAEGVGPCYRD